MIYADASSGENISFQGNYFISELNNRDKYTMSFADDDTYIPLTFIRVGDRRRGREL